MTKATSLSMDPIPFMFHICSLAFQMLLKLKGLKWYKKKQEKLRNKERLISLIFSTLLEHIFIQNPYYFLYLITVHPHILVSIRWDSYVQSIWCQNSRKFHYFISSYFLPPAMNNKYHVTNFMCFSHSIFKTDKLEFP